MAFIKLVDHINKIVLYILAILLAIMSILVFMQVLVRSFFTTLSIPWAEEYARYLMIWSIFLGAGVATRKAKLISIDMFVNAIPKHLGQTLKYLSHIITIVFMAIIFVIGISWAKFGLNEFSPATNLPKIYVYLSLSSGAFLMIINTIALLIETIVNKQDIRHVSMTEEKEVLQEVQGGQ